MKRVTRVSVTQLFGIFNHVIPMNLEEQITIIHGPNGFGKTAVLRLLDAICNARYSTLRDILYTEFRVDFEDQSSVVVNRSLDEGKKGRQVKLTISYHSKDSERQQFSPRLGGSDLVEGVPSGYLEDAIPGIRRIDADLWRYLPSGEVMSGEELLDRFQSQLGPLVGARAKVKDMPVWLAELDGLVHFVQAQRLFGPTVARPYGRMAYRAPEVRSALGSVVLKYSDELGKAIQAKLAESAALSQRLDRTFPSRVVGEGAHVNISSQDLRAKLAHLEERRSNLMAAGLLDKDDDANFQVPQQIDETTKSVLSVYVKDVEQKLSVFDDIADKIDTLKSVISKRFLYKALRIDKINGFTFATWDGKQLSPDALSSGEQNELVLLYELLFRVQAGSLILIDEPEISLHIAWQAEFLHDLQQIIELNNLDILIATHSPEIISDHWNLTVPLEGPEQ